MSRFKQVPLTDHFNSTADVPTSSENGEPVWHEWLAENIKVTPLGDYVSWGIPFELGRKEQDDPCLIVLHPGAEPVKVNLSGKATHICFMHVANMPEDYHSNFAQGGTLAEYVVRYKDGGEHVQPIRMRFEVSSPADWGRHAFAAVPAFAPRVVAEGEPHPWGWGWQQTGVFIHGPHHSTWVYALELPDSDSELESVTLKPLSGLMAVFGITLYDGPGHPLRHVPRHVYKLVLPEKVMETDLQTKIDMGFITRTYAVPGCVDEEWVKSQDAALQTPRKEAVPADEYLVEATGALGATLSVQAGNRSYDLDFGKAYEEGESAALDGSARVEILDKRKAWLHASVIDTSTGKPTPTRIRFCGPHGEYLPPYGHAQVVNDRWFEDYGGDLQIGAASYAYVPGEFQVELPEGDVYVEICKGFEYTPVRQKLQIRHGQKELKLGISRWTDLRSRNWVTADTHVHFISPDTAWLEGQAEGINLVNLLASQWGKLFTNVADISGGLAGCSRDDTLVWVGTENRHHLLGHISMLGTKGEPVYPLCRGGTDEAFFGDPDSMLLTEWAEKCREREGVVIRPHFPGPVCEEPVYLVLEKVDGIETRPNDAVFREWYRYLNCGCRVAAVGGTDKMSARMPVGGIRTYAQIDPNEEFSFASWGQAVRAGRTFMSSGPIISLTVDGRAIGDEIRLPSGGGKLEVKAEAECAWPIDGLLVTVNGRTVAQTEASGGAKRLSISETIEVTGSCWIAARCWSRDRKQGGGYPIAAHTSPIYVVVDDQEVFNQSDASYMLTLIEGGLTYLDTLAVRSDEERHLAMKGLFEQARRIIHRKMHENGIEH